MIREARGKAEEAEQTHFGGKNVWNRIRDMQHGRRGLVPSRSVTIKDEDGNSRTTPLVQQQQWQRQFTRALNVQSQFNIEVVLHARQRSLKEQLEQKPSMRELKVALNKLKNGKASGTCSSNIRPEMVKAVYEEESLGICCLT